MVCLFVFLFSKAQKKADRFPNNITVQEITYAYVTWIFCTHFLNRLGTEYQNLASVLNVSDPQHQSVLLEIKKRLREDTFTRESIIETMVQYPQLIKMCYVNFAMKHYINTAVRPGKAALR